MSGCSVCGGPSEKVLTSYGEAVVVRGRIAELLARLEPEWRRWVLKDVQHEGGG